MKTALVFSKGNFVGREYYRCMVAAGMTPDVCIAVGVMSLESRQYEVKRTGGFWKPPEIPGHVFEFESFQDYILWNMLRDVDIAVQAGCGLIHRNALAMPKLGWVGVHPGKLPNFKGSSCPEWAILAGHTRIWLTAHLLDEGLDSGPLIWERPYQLHRGQTYYEWRAGIYPAAGECLVRALRHLSDAKPESLHEYVSPQVKGAGFVYPRVSERDISKVRRLISIA